MLAIMLRCTTFEQDRRHPWGDTLSFGVLGVYESITNDIFSKKTLHTGLFVDKSRNTFDPPQRASNGSQVL